MSKSLGHATILILNSQFSIFLDCNREDKVARADIVDNILALHHLAKAGVNAVKVLGVAAVVADEELRATGILATMRHREHTSVVVLTLCIGLARNSPTRTTCTVADRATTLNYKLGNHSVEGRAVIEA